MLIKELFLIRFGSPVCDQSKHIYLYNYDAYIIMVILNFSNYSFPAEDRPDLVTLVQFQVTPQSTVNVIEDVSASFRTLGTILLQDRSGSKVEAIAMSYQNRAVDIMHSVISKWLSGAGLQPVTWSGFVSSLRAAGLHNIANDIEAVLF